MIMIILQVECRTKLFIARRPRSKSESTAQQGIVELGGRGEVE
jgi:hypothetical protein